MAAILDNQLLPDSAAVMAGLRFIVKRKRGDQDGLTMATPQPFSPVALTSGFVRGQGVVFHAGPHQLPAGDRGGLGRGLQRALP